MPWIELHQNILRHPKLIRLSVRLSVKKQDALWHLLSLWLWALDYAEKGDLSGFGPAEIADAADWRGEPADFLAGLQESKWMDGMSLHDWMDYAGRLVEQREANKERMRGKRAAHVQRTTGARVEHVGGLPNQPTNQPDQTEAPAPTQADISAIAKAVYDAYPDTAKKDRRPTGKGIAALGAITHAVTNAPDFPWVEYAGLIAELVETPKNITTWAHAGPDALGLEALRKIKAGKEAKTYEGVDPSWNKRLS